MSSPLEDRLLLSISEVHRVFPLGRTRIYELINDGTLESVKVGKRRFIKMSSLRKLAEEPPSTKDQNGR